MKIMRKKLQLTSGKIFLLILCIGALASMASGKEKQYIVGAYYFGGWQSGPNFHLEAPHALLLEPSFKNRMPLSGWFDDQQAVMDQELVWAERGGISFFAFLWYWPGAMSREEDKLNYPLECYLNPNSNAKKKMKFCIVYTNHDKFDISPRDQWDRYATLWTEWMTREDYVRVSVQEKETAKPLFIIWSPQRFHEHWDTMPGGARAALDNFRKMAVKRGLPGINIGGCWDQSYPKEILKEDDYDIITGYGSHDAGGAKVGSFGQYDSLSVGHISVWDSMNSLGKRVIPNMTSGWDPRPWPDELKVSYYYPDRSPSKFKEFCQFTKDWINKHENDVVKPKTILIYAWNELGEGGYIVPTVGEGFAYLDAIKKVFGKAESTKK
jgi:hypothetical protein